MLLANKPKTESAKSREKPAEADLIDFPLDCEDQERLAEINYHEEVVLKSSAVRTVSKTEFGLIQAQHEASVKHKAKMYKETDVSDEVDLDATAENGPLRPRGPYQF
jgi:hypothetical protein